MFGPQNAGDADQNPKAVEHRVGGVAFQAGAPGEKQGVEAVQAPDDQKRAGRTAPAHHGKTADAQQNAKHFDGLDVSENK